MRHVTLTCKNHPNLRWSCKSIAYSPGVGYNGQRHIFFMGSADAPWDVVKDGKVIAECACPSTELVLAPDDPWHTLTLDQQRAAIAND